MKNLSFLLLNPPSEEIVLRDNYCSHSSKADYYWAPSDLLYISGHLDGVGVIDVIDCIAEKMSELALLERVERATYTHIIALTGSVSFNYDIKLLQEIKKESRLYICGNLPSFSPLGLMEQFRIVDGIIHNFFDIRIKDHFLNNAEVSTISHRVDSEIRSGKINDIPKSDVSVPVPRSELFPLSKYKTPFSRKSPMTTMILSFGCPYSCKFCVASELNSSTRTLENIGLEFEHYRKTGVQEIFFMDSTFNLSSKWLREVCNLIIEGNYDFSWSCNIHSLTITQDDLRILKRAGCHTIQIGVEARKEETRKEFAPSKKTDSLEDVFKMAKDVGLDTLGYFILGFPNESTEDVEETIQFAKKLNPKFASFTTLVADVGTVFYKEQFGLTQDYNIMIDNSSNPNAEGYKTSPEERSMLIRAAYKGFYLRPSKIIELAFDVYGWGRYFSNGLGVLRKYIFQ